NVKTGVYFKGFIGHAINIDTCTFEGNENGIEMDSYYGSLSIDNCYFEHNVKHLVGAELATSSSASIVINSSYFWFDHQKQIEFKSRLNSFSVTNTELFVTENVDSLFTFH